MYNKLDPGTYVLLPAGSIGGARPILLIDDATTLLATTSDRIIVQVTAKVNSNVPNISG